MFRLIHYYFTIFKIAKQVKIGYSLRISAPVVQWTEQARPKGSIWVRFLAGAQFITHNLQRIIRNTP